MTEQEKLLLTLQQDPPGAHWYFNNRDHEYLFRSPTEEELIAGVHPDTLIFKRRENDKQG